MSRSQPVTPSKPQAHHALWREAVEAPKPPLGGLTAVEGVKVGHCTLARRLTGCSVVLTEEGAVAGVDVRGGAPGSREIALLDPVNTLDQVHGLVLSGGSAFGLDAAGGAVRFLEERGVGFDTGVGLVPIVPAAILFDLATGEDPTIRPSADHGYRAAGAASTHPVVEGNVGAGAGAAVGKLAGMARAMKGGLGSSAVRLPDGTTVGALFAVNPVGNVLDPRDGRTLAGLRTADGQEIADLHALLRQGRLQDPLANNKVSSDDQPAPGTNTTIGVVATNAKLDKARVTKLAQMAQDGLARTIFPSHTPWDGDTVFALATGRSQTPVDLTTLGALAAEVTAEAIVRAVLKAHSIPGLPSAQKLH